MTYPQSIAFLEGLDSSIQKLALERVDKVLGSMGNPQDALAMVHITGTNGKGSLSAILSAILQAAGYSVGMFSSPHLVDVRERITMNGQLIPETDFAEQIAWLHGHIVHTLKLAPAFWPTYFEWLNIMAYRYFTQQQVDISIVEVGLGGRLDSTNIVKKPIVSVITGIGMDHTHILGNTLEAIAQEKAGIIKAKVPIITGPNLSPSVKDVIEQTAQALNAPLIQSRAEHLKINPSSSLKDGLIIDDVDSKSQYRLSLRAPYQAENLATALTVIDYLRETGWKIPSSAVASGVQNVQWPARFQVFPQARLIIDGSHNAQGFESLKQALMFYLPDQPIYWLLSLQKNRNLQPLLQLIQETPNSRGLVWTSAADSDRYHRPSDAAQTAKAFLKNDLEILAAEDVESGLFQMQSWLNTGTEAYGIISGSLYTAGDALKLFLTRP